MELPSFAIIRHVVAGTCAFTRLMCLVAHSGWWRNNRMHHDAPIPLKAPGKACKISLSPAIAA